MEKYYLSDIKKAEVLELLNDAIEQKISRKGPSFLEGNYSDYYSVQCLGCFSDSIEDEHEMPTLDSIKHHPGCLVKRLLDNQKRFIDRNRSIKIDKS